VSSERAILKKYDMIGGQGTSGDMSADILSEIVHLYKIDQVSLQVQWTSADAIGVIEVEGSVDGETFTALTFSPALTQPNSDNGLYLINMALIPFMHIRVRYTRTSGSGTLSVKASAKGN
jgi:hypothetical protein